MTAFSDERREEIVRLVGESGRMSVKRLAELLGVTPMTIRRDLSELEREDMLRRVHGAAVLGSERGYAEKAGERRDEKRAIAERAVSLVRPGDTLFLDAGTTTYEIAQLLLDFEGLTVITNDIKIAFLLSCTEGVEVMCCGGTVQKETGSIMGMFASQLVGYVQFDRAFMGAASINAQFNVLTPTMEKATLKRTVLSNSSESYLVVDASKFNRRALMKVNGLEAYTGVITTYDFSDAELSLLDRRGVHLIGVHA